MRQKIIKPAPYKFRIQWDNKKYEKDVIELNFEPLIKEYNLTGNFVLLHWQNKPLGLRRFGVYDGQTDQYYGFDWDKLDCLISSVAKLEALQLNELKWINIRPTAVFCIKGVSVFYENDRFVIQSNNQNFPETIYVDFMG